MALNYRPPGEGEVFNTFHDMVHAAILYAGTGTATLKEIYAACIRFGRVKCRKTGGWRLVTERRNWKSHIRHTLYTTEKFLRCPHDSDSWMLAPEFCQTRPQTTRQVPGCIFTETLVVAPSQIGKIVPSVLPYTAGKAAEQGAPCARLLSENTAEQQRWPGRWPASGVPKERVTHTADDRYAGCTDDEPGEDEDNGLVQEDERAAGPVCSGIRGAAAQAYWVGSRSGRVQALLGVTAAAAAAAAAGDEELNLNDDEACTALLAAQEVLNNPAAARILLHLMQQRQQQQERQDPRPAPAPRWQQRQSLDEEEEDADPRGSFGGRLQDDVNVAAAAWQRRAPRPGFRGQEVRPAYQQMARRPAHAAHAAPFLDAGLRGVRGEAARAPQPKHGAPAYAPLARASSTSVPLRQASRPSYQELYPADAGLAAAEAEVGAEEDAEYPDPDPAGEDAGWDDTGLQLGHQHGNLTMLSVAGTLPRGQPPFGRRHGLEQPAMAATRRAGGALLPAPGRRPASPPQPPARHPPSPQLMLAAAHVHAAAAAAAAAAVAGEAASRRESQKAVAQGKRRVTNSSSSFGAEMGDGGEEQQQLPKRMCRPFDLGRVVAELQASRRRSSSTAAPATGLVPAADVNKERAGGYAGYLIY